jgi:hypothetical protein
MLLMTPELAFRDPWRHRLGYIRIGRHEINKYIPKNSAPISGREPERIHRQREAEETYQDDRLTTNNIGEPAPV